MNEPSYSTPRLFYPASRQFRPRVFSNKWFLLPPSAVVALAWMSLCAAAPADTKILEIAKAGHVAPVDDPESQAAVTYWLQQFMLSCLVRDVVLKSSLEEWRGRLSSTSHIYLRYGSTVTLAIPERQMLTFNEVLLPLPSDQFPDYVYIKRGQHVLRLSKYDPWVLHKLVSEAGLPLYKNLANVERGLF